MRPEYAVDNISAFPPPSATHSSSISYIPFRLGFYHHLAQPFCWFVARSLCNSPTHPVKLLSIILPGFSVSPLRVALFFVFSRFGLQLFVLLDRSPTQACIITIDDIVFLYVCVLVFHAFSFTIPWGIGLPRCLIRSAVPLSLLSFLSLSSLAFPFFVFSCFSLIEPVFS